MFNRQTWFLRGGVAFLLVLAAGCSKPTAVVSGKVTYQGRPLPMGTVRFLTVENKVLAAEIEGDGNYSIARVPLGEVKVTVSVPRADTLRPQQKGMYGKAGDNPSAGSAPAPAPRVMRIPDEYGTPETSGLKYTVTAEPDQKFDITLK